MTLTRLLAVQLLVASARPARPAGETSFWLHASLPRGGWARGYWETDPPSPPAIAASADEVHRAASLLANSYHSNTLYLLYHEEVSWAVIRPLYRAWRASVPADVELVPTLLLRVRPAAPLLPNGPSGRAGLTGARCEQTYNASEGIAPTGGRLNFGAEHSNATLEHMLDFFRELGVKRLGVFDVYPDRDQGPGPGLAARHGLGLTRVGLQPTEPLAALYGGGVEDTWSGVCCGRTNALWATLRCGEATVRQWAALRMADKRPFSFDLIVVAWDYDLTPNGTNPGIDDATKNQPLPAGRTALAVAALEQAAAAHGRGASSVGLSSDLTILEANGQVPQREGPNRTIYSSLRSGRLYWQPGEGRQTYFGRAFREVVEAFARRRPPRVPS